MYAGELVVDYLVICPFATFVAGDEVGIGEFFMWCVTVGAETASASERSTQQSRSGFSATK